MGARKQKKELVKSLKKLIKRVKKSEIEDLEVEANHKCPALRYADEYGVMRAVPGATTYTDINIKFVTRRNQ